MQSEVRYTCSDVTVSEINFDPYEQYIDICHAFLFTFLDLVSTGMWMDNEW